MCHGSNSINKFQHNTRVHSRVQLCYTKFVYYSDFWLNPIKKIYAYLSTLIGCPKYFKHQSERIEISFFDSVPGLYRLLYVVIYLLQLVLKLRKCYLPNICPTLMLISLGSQLPTSKSTQTLPIICPTFQVIIKLLKTCQTKKASALTDQYPSICTLLRLMKKKETDEICPLGYWNPAKDHPGEAEQCDYILEFKVAHFIQKLLIKQPKHIYLKSVLFQNTYAKSTNGNSCKLICYRELSKIVQSGHTFSFVLRLVRDFNFNDVYLPKKDASLMSVVVLQWPQNRAEQS